MTQPPDAIGLQNSPDILAKAWRASLPWLLFLGVVLVQAIRSDAPGSWFDETHRLFLAGLPLRDAWGALVADGGHPPLYYGLIRVALMFGAGESVLRMPPVLLSAAGVPALYVLGRRWAGDLAALIASRLLMLSPLGIWYSREASIYALLGLGCLVCLLTFDGLLGAPSHWRALAFLLARTLAFLTHYFALLLPVVELAYLAVRLRSQSGILVRWTRLQVVAAIPLPAWIVALLSRQGKYFGHGWRPAPQPIDPLLSMMNFTFGSKAPQPAWKWAGLAG